MRGRARRPARDRARAPDDLPARAQPAGPHRPDAHAPLRAREEGPGVTRSGTSRSGNTSIAGACAGELGTLLLQVLLAGDSEVGEPWAGGIHALWSVRSSSK